jgi:SAM-dependent methyltransferase
MQTVNVRDQEVLLGIAETIAPTWERRRAEIEEFAKPFRDWLIRELRPLAGDTILELAAGVGDTGFEAAALVGDDGVLITSDFSSSMLDAARRRGHELGLTNVDYRVIDAQQLDLWDASVDGVLCRFGFMLMPEPAQAFAEARRVLRRGGRLVLAVWGPLEKNPFFSIAAMSLIRRGHIPPPEPPPAPGPFSMASSEHLEGLLRDAGFLQVRTQELAGRFVCANAEDYVGFTADTAGPIELALQRLDPGDRAAIEADVADSLQPFAAGSRGYEIPSLALCAVAS